MLYDDVQVIPDMVTESDRSAVNCDQIVSSVLCDDGEVIPDSVTESDSDPDICTTIVRNARKILSLKTDESLYENVVSDDSVADPDFKPGSDSEDEESDDDDMDIDRHVADLAAKQHSDSVTDDSSVAAADSSCSTPVDIANHVADLAAKQHSDSVTDDSPVAAADSSCSTAVKIGLRLHKKRSLPSGCKRVYDKVHFCTFCKSRIVSNIARHLVTVHVDQTAVTEILMLPKQSQQRKVLLQRLVNDGNFQHNITAIQQGKGEIVVGRRSTVTDKKASDYVPCTFCKRWQSKKNAWRHAKSCTARKEYYETHPQTDSCAQKRTLAVKRGQQLVNNAAFSNDEDSLAVLMNRMRDDEVKEIVMGDELLKREAALRVTALGRKKDQKQDDVYRVSQAVRTLGRVVLFARQSVPNITLTELIKPNNFDMVVDIAKKMSVQKERPALNVGITIGNLLLKACESKYCASLRKYDKQGQAEATDFRKLTETEWNSRVNRAAVKQMQKEKRMQVPVIPLTDDLKVFRSYLLRNIQQLSDKMMNQPDPASWVKLAKCVMCRLIMFNKRRRAEVRELRVEDYLARPVWNSDMSGEMALALTAVDRLLAQR